MRVYVHGIVSFSVSILLLFSCGRKSEPLEVAADTFSQVEVPNAIAGATPPETSKVEQDENYKAALRAQMSGLKKMAKVVKNGGFGDKGEFLKWMQGTWIWREQIPNHGTHLYRLVVNGEKITSFFDDSMNDKGEIKYYDVENGFLTFGDRSEVVFDNERRIIYLDVNREEGVVYERQTSSPNNTSRENSSSSSSTQYSSLRARYDRLNEQATKIVERYDRERWTGARSDWPIMALQLRDINDEKISIARKLGDQELLRISIYQKNLSEAALRQMGLL